MNKQMKIILVVGALGVAGFLGWKWYQAQQLKKNLASASSAVAGATAQGVADAGGGVATAVGSVAEGVGGFFDSLGEMFD